ncbi:hypothetical protein SB776_35975, partial [Burkholderia sp. SIMBA_045]
MTNTHEWVRDGYQAHITDLQSVALEELPWFFEQIKTHHKCIVDNIDLLPPEATAERAEFEREQIKSVICVGLVANQHLLGFVG